MEKYRVVKHNDGSIDFINGDKKYHFEAKENHPNLDEADIKFMSNLYLYGITELFDYNIAYLAFTQIKLKSKILTFDMLINHLYIHLHNINNENLNDVFILRKVQKIVHLLKD